MVLCINGVTIHINGLILTFLKELRNLTPDFFFPMIRNIKQKLIDQRDLFFLNLAQPALNIHTTISVYI